jgi:hypothetical protein
VNLHKQTDKSPYQYRGMFHALGTVYREEGFRALYKGWLPSVIGVVGSLWKSPRGRVNSRNLKIINFEYAPHLGLGLEISSKCGRLFLLLWVAQAMQITLGANSKQYEQRNFKEMRGEKQIEWRSTQVNTVICFPRFGSKEPSTCWGGHTGRVYSNHFPLSIGHLDRSNASS